MLGLNPLGVYGWVNEFINPEIELYSVNNKKITIHTLKPGKLFPKNKVFIVLAVIFHFATLSLHQHTSLFLVGKFYRYEEMF